MTGNGRQASEPPFDVEDANDAANGADEVGASKASKAAKRVNEADRTARQGEGLGRGPARGTGRGIAGGAAAGAAVGGAAAAGVAAGALTMPSGPTAPVTWRKRLLPKTVRGMVSLIVAASVGAALSGTILYAYYQYRLNQTEQRVGSFVNGFDQRFKTAVGTIQADQANAQA
ncbi:MAG TPA: hypothetical protein VGL32_06310, partial [Acidimicrobiales bacterium]